ncbi:MAG: Sensory box histidine kinase [Thermoleophilia bacterium]|nr:Sensory box histidine kinase [Thermoleophilia bacterium]
MGWVATWEAQWLDANRWPLSLRTALLFVAYFVSGAASLHLQTDAATVGPIWLASGVALAAVLAWGPRVAIGSFLADVLLSMTVSDLPLGVSIGVSAGDTAELLAAAWITLAIGETVAFSHSRCVLGLTIAAPIAAAVSASVAILLLSSAGQLVLDPDRAWVRYWLSTVSGMVIVAPLLLSWLRGSWRGMRRRRVGEAFLLGGALLAVGSVVFSRATWNFLDVLVVLPLFSWAIIRFGTRGATGSTALFAGLLAYGVVGERSLLADAPLNVTTDAMQVLVLMLAIANLTIASTLNERNEANEGMRDLLESFDRSQRVAHVGSWEIRLDGTRRIWCSAELCRMLQLQCEHGERLSIEEMLASVHELDRELLRRTVERHARAGTPFEVEHRVADGSNRVLRHIAGVVPGKRGDPADRLLVGSVLDVTEEHELERFQNDLIATASHELRTPLTSILGFATTIDAAWDQLDDADRHAYVGIIVAQARRLERLVEETLLQSKVDAGAVRGARRPFLVGRTARRVAESLDLHDVEYDFQPGVLAVADPEQFEQVVANLLTNAVKYGSSPYVVRVRDRGDGEVELRVEDHGAGLPAGFGTRAFDRFSRGPDVGTAPGTGLGLSIAKGLVESAGGTIHHERWNGVTAFVVRLPGDPRGAVPEMDVTGEFEIPRQD